MSEPFDVEPEGNMEDLLKEFSMERKSRLEIRRNAVVGNGN